MPSSQYYQLNEILEIVMLLKPRSVLEIGPGFGKYGFLCREYLELWDGRERYGDWQCRIDCIEACEQYVTPAHRFIYDNIYTGNALDLLSQLENRYDLVLMVDVLEHFSFDDGLNLLQQCQALSDHILIASPRHVNLQEGVFGNPYERHRFEWNAQHLRCIGPVFTAPHHSTLICLTGSRAQEIRSQYLRIHTRRFLKRHLSFFLPIRRFFFHKQATLAEKA